MGILEAGLWGALGGLCVDALMWFGRISAWSVDRRLARERGEPDERLPQLRQYIDVAADSLALVTRVVLSAMAGVVFSGQITGPVAAMYLGAAAPALLLQLGRVSTVRSALTLSAPELRAPAPAPAPSDEPADAAEVEAP
ncbi:hypothetical protein [Streptomyces mirabilis]|uniref:hypothetical protein n=1 Tax=Streptomyces mirabilis TaxID=68239 RepID=UPI00368E3AA7